MITNVNWDNLPIDGDVLLILHDCRFLFLPPPPIIGTLVPRKLIANLYDDIHF